MKKLLSLITVLCIILFTPTKKANALVIDFESLSDGDIVTNQFSGLGVTFSNTQALTAGITLNEFEFPPHSGVNVVSTLDGTLPMTLQFSTPFSAAGGFFNYTTSTDTLFLSAFDPSGNLLTTVKSAFNSNLALSGDPGSSPNEFMGISGVGPIGSLQIFGDPGSSFTLDDFIGTPASQGAGSIPEPSSLLLLASEFAGMVGLRKFYKLWRI